MVILSILKVTGMVLLVILAVILVLLCMVLFFPIHYRAKGKSEPDSLDIHVRVNWLLCILGAGIDYTADKTDIYYRILFIKRPFSKKDKKKSSETEDEELSGDSEGNKEQLEENLSDSDENLPEVSLYIDSPERPVKIHGREDESAKSPKVKNNGDDEDDKNSKDDRNNRDDKDDKNNKDDRNNRDSKEDKNNKDDKDDRNNKAYNVRKKLTEKISDVVSKLKKVGTIKEKAAETVNKVNKLNNPKALNHIKKELFYLLKVLFPKRLKLSLLFSAGDPAYTGMLLGILAMFPAGYRNEWNISPDFESEKAYAEGNFDVSGFLFVFQILFIIIRIIIDKECRKLYNTIMK